MSKWTQEQREAAKDQLFETRRNDPEERLIALACQRNELLDALKLAYETLTISLGGEEFDRRVQVVFAAIAKAEAG